MLDLRQLPLASCEYVQRRAAEVGILRLSAVLIFLWLSVSVNLSACTPREPALSSDFAQEIKEALGYALAPTYLPKGFESTTAVEGMSPVLTTGETVFVGLSYTEYSPSQGSNLILIYPLPNQNPDYMMKLHGLTVPEDAVSEIRINGEPAFLFYGNWTEETLEQISQAIMPINPEWDYESSHISIKFTFSMPNGEKVWVSLGTIFPNDEVAEKDIIRIAESVVLVD